MTASENKINWSYLCLNSNAIELLKENRDKIDWFWLLSNINPNAFDIIEKKI